MTQPTPVKVERKILEKHVEQRLITGVKRLGGYSFKWSSQNVRGVPDRVVVLPGPVVWFIELKKKGGRLSPLQKQFMAKMHDLKFDHAIVLTGIEEVEEWLGKQMQETESWV